MAINILCDESVQSAMSFHEVRKETIITLLSWLQRVHSNFVYFKMKFGYAAMWLVWSLTE
jgi:hypothetical protein